MKKITIELSTTSCNEATKELEEYARKIEPKMREVCQKLAEIGLVEAQAHLGGSFGNTDASLSTAPTGNGYKIVMSGTDVYFIEFGTGDQVSPHGNTSVPVAWGSWSAENKQQLWNYGFWWYGGERLTGTPAYMPMYYAGRKIRESIPQVVKEVFGS